MRRSIQIGLATAAIFFSGCVTKSTDNQESSYGFSLWFPLGMAVGGPLLIALGVALAPGNRHKGSLICGGLALLYMVPNFYFDQAVVDAKHVQGCTGYWPLMDHFDVTFDELKSIRMESQERRTRRGGRTTDHYLHFFYKSGDEKRHLMGYVLKAAMEDIVTNARTHGVRIDYQDNVRRNHL